VKLSELPPGTVFDCDPGRIVEAGALVADSWAPPSRVFATSTEALVSEYGWGRIGQLVPIVQTHWMTSLFGPPDSFTAIGGRVYRSWRVEA